MKTYFFVLFQIFLVQCVLFAQSERKSVLLNTGSDFVPFNVKVSEEIYQEKKSLTVIDLGKDSEVKFVKIKNLNFRNGSIEINLAGTTMANSSEQARGFVGIAFRINDDNSKFECFYLRPTNGRADDQVRRNHSAQYISFPEFPWFRLRKDFPEKYESYVDLVPGEWTKVRIEVEGNRAKLFVHGNSQPTLIVNDLKHGPEAEGNIGLWIGPGTVAHFADLYVSN